MLVTGRQAAFVVSRNPNSARVITPALVIDRLALQLPLLASLPNSGVRCYSAPSQTITHGDVVLLERLAGSQSQILTSPLAHGRKTASRLFGDIQQSDIIGKRYREIVRSTKGSLFRIHQPTLGDYVTLTPRRVTPIYPGETNVIVSLLDIHVQPQVDPNTENALPLEILEAGTGHGSLTLYLARAVHAANPPPPSPWDELTEDGKNAILAWKSRRRATIHTIDRSQEYSDAARKIVHGFRKGIYAGHVDFHVGNVSDFVSPRTEQTGRDQVFTHVVLDLPDVHLHLASAAWALHDNGTLLVFCPSVTQIAACVRVIREQDLPLEHVQVLELGSSYSGGKPWDVRAAKLRHPGPVAEALVAQTPATPPNKSVMAKLSDMLFQGSSPDTNKHPPNPPQERWEMVCRPSVGHRVVGGGFVGMWKRRRIVEADERGKDVEDASTAASKVDRG